MFILLIALYDIRYNKGLLLMFLLSLTDLEEPITIDTLWAYTNVELYTSHPWLTMISMHLHDDFVANAPNYPERREKGAETSGSLGILEFSWVDWIAGVNLYR